VSTKTVLEANFDNCPYRIYIGRRLLGALPELLNAETRNRDVLIVADRFFEHGVVKDVADSLSAAGFTVLCHIMGAGKESKTISEVLKIYGTLEENDFARDATIIAIGGGVVGDLSGFVASTWLRGINFVQIPTTLMGMVDSSVGGKVAVNFRRTINGIGNYYHPLFILMDLDFVDSLADRDYFSGLAEVVKCGVISDERLLVYLENNAQALRKRDPEAVVHCISGALKTKIEHVSGDTKEGGKRLLLNYGHTLGHAIEMSTLSAEEELLRHGEGVALGMTAVAIIAEDYLNAPMGLKERVESLLALYDLPTYFECSSYGLRREDVLKNCKENINKDKKRKNNHLRLILSERHGQAAVHEDVPAEFINSAFSALIRE
jgi:3-dehydroquinate synthase